MYRSTFDARKEQEQPEDGITEEIPRPSEPTKKNSECNHSWKYLTDAIKRSRRTSFHMGQEMTSNAPMPDADCTKCGMVLHNGEACHWSPFGRVARPWNGN